MNRSSPLRTLSLFTLLSLVGVAQAHAEPVAARYPSPQVAESGSERAQERANSFRDRQAQKLAENGSERSAGRHRKLVEKPSVQVAENGSERSHKRTSRTNKLRGEQAPIIAEGGSDRLLIWHQQRSA